MLVYDLNDDSGNTFAEGLPFFEHCLSPLTMVAMFGMLSKIGVSR